MGERIELSGIASARDSGSASGSVGDRDIARDSARDSARDRDNARLRQLTNSSISNIFQSISSFLSFIRMNFIRIIYGSKVNSSITPIGLIVVDRIHATKLYNQGAFGKATLSRGVPTWYQRHFGGRSGSGMSETRRMNAFLESGYTVPMVDSEQYVLMPEEAFYLAHVLNVLKVRDANDVVLSLAQMWDLFTAQYQDPSEPTKKVSSFAARYAVYHHYRTKGLTPRSGLLFGFDFVLYTKGPQYRHADSCVWILELQGNEQVRTLAAKSRIANSVKKVRRVALTEGALDLLLGYSRGYLRCGMSEKVYD